MRQPWGDARHCPKCYLAVLYGIDLLSTNVAQSAFSARKIGINKGITSFLSHDYSTAGYILLPIADGIVTSVMCEDGLLMNTKTFPKWTKEHPVVTMQGKNCTNLLSALEVAETAGEMSRLHEINKWLSNPVIKGIKELRNNLLHGTLLEVSEHQAGSVVLLIHAIYHGIII